MYVNWIQSSTQQAANPISCFFYFLEFSIFWCFYFYSQLTRCAEKQFLKRLSWTQYNCPSACNQFVSFEWVLITLHIIICWASMLSPCLHRLMIAFPLFTEYNSHVDPCSFPHLLPFVPSIIPFLRQLPFYPVYFHSWANCFRCLPPYSPRLSHDHYTSDYLQIHADSAPWGSFITAFPSHRVAIPCNCLNLSNSSPLRPSGGRNEKNKAEGRSATERERRSSSPRSSRKCKALETRLEMPPPGLVLHTDSYGRRRFAICSPGSHYQIRRQI